MSLEQFEIALRKHYQVSLALLEQIKRGVDLASTEEERRTAEERYRQFLHLHQSVEERYRKYWEDCESGVGVAERDISDAQ